MQDSLIQGVDSPDMRRAGRELLSVALMDARNHTLNLIGQLAEGLEPAGFVVPLLSDLDPRRCGLLGHVGWFQEWWIARNVHRHRGARADPAGYPPAVHRVRNPTLVERCPGAA